MQKIKILILHGIHYICSAWLTDSPHEFPDSNNSKSSVNQIIWQEGAQKNQNDCANLRQGAVQSIL